MQTKFLNRRRFFAVAAVSLGAGGLGGCESLADIGSLLDRPPPPLPGERRPVFPEGVRRDTSVPQPMNSPIDQQPEPAPEPAPTTRRRSRG